MIIDCSNHFKSCVISACNVRWPITRGFSGVSSPQAASSQVKPIHTLYHIDSPDRALSTAKTTDQDLEREVK
jgi:hypothetical protein